MKVLLLEHPRLPSSDHVNDVANAPLSACLMTGYVAACLRRAGLEAEVLEAHLEGITFKETSERVLGKNWDILGVHLVYFWEKTDHAFQLLQKISQKAGSRPIVLYGFYPTFAYREILTHYPFIAAVVVGEPEGTFLGFCKATKKRGSTLSAGTIAGIACRNGPGIVKGPPRQLVGNLDTLPFPVHSDLFLEKVGVNILASRGCYGRCSFCYINPFYGEGSKWRGRSPENVVKEGVSLLSRSKYLYFYFVDGNFFGPGDAGQRRAKEIARLLCERADATFGMECRVNDIQQPSLSFLAKAGLKDVFLGVEGASARSLRRMHKGISMAQTDRALTLLRDYGIEPTVGFIMFEPQACLQDIRANFSYLASRRLLTKLENTANLLYHPHIALMGTDSYWRLKRSGRLFFKAPIPYEGSFSHKDERVGFLYDVISPVSRYALKAMPPTPSSLLPGRRASSHDEPDPGTRDEINDCLVEFFEQTLRKLELNALTLTGSVKEELISKGIETIDGKLPNVRAAHAT